MQLVVWIFAELNSAIIQVLQIYYFIQSIMLRESLPLLYFCNKQLENWMWTFCFHQFLLCATSSVLHLYTLQKLVIFRVNLALMKAKPLVVRTHNSAYTSRI